MFHIKNKLKIKEWIPSKLLFHYLAWLNMFDAFATAWGVENGFISEFNPVMDRLLEINPFLFITVKLSLSIGLYAFIVAKKFPRSRIVRGAAVIGAAIYSVAFGLHCFWISCILFL